MTGWVFVFVWFVGFFDKMLNYYLFVYILFVPLTEICKYYSHKLAESLDDMYMSTSLTKINVEITGSLAKRYLLW